MNQSIGVQKHLPESFCARFVSLRARRKNVRRLKTASILAFSVSAAPSHFQFLLFVGKRGRAATAIERQNFVVLSAGCPFSFSIPFVLQASSH